MKTRGVLHQVLFFATLALVITFTSASLAQTMQDISGVWKGTLEEVGGAGSAEFVLRLTQNGEKVSGSYDVPHARVRPPLVDVAVEGSLSGNVLSLKIPSIPHGGIQATFTGNTMEGTYYGRSGRLNKLNTTRVK